MLTRVIDVMTMLYLARVLYMPWGEELHSRVVGVAAGKVQTVSPFEKELPSMILMDEVYITSFDSAISVSDIKIEIHHAGGSLYAYSANEAGVLTRLL